MGRWVVEHDRWARDDEQYLVVDTDTDTVIDKCETRSEAENEVMRLEDHAADIAAAEREAAEDAAFDRMWRRRELANEAGMGLGIDAYNDIMEG